MNSKLLAGALGLSLAVSAQAQQTEKRHYLGVNLGGGIHTLLYSAENGNKALGFGGLVQVQYQYQFNKNWSVGGGVSLATLHSSAIYNYVDDLGTAFLNVKDKQDMLDLALSAEAFYTKCLCRKWSLQAGLGVSLNYSPMLHYSLRNPATNIEPLYGTSGSVSRRDLNFGVLFDAGVLYAWKSNMDLYAGIYGSYQFLSTAKTHSDYMVTENVYNNSLNTRYVGAIHPLEAGVKVGVRFALGKKAKACKETASRPVPRRVIKDIKCIEQSAYFETSSIVPMFKDGADEAFVRVKKYLDWNQDKNVYLTGHTDNTGSDAFNMNLSKKRAEAYKGALVKKGISNKRIFTDGKGKTQPVATNDTEEGRALNRRVDMKIK